MTKDEALALQPGDNIEVVNPADGTVTDYVVTTIKIRTEVHDDVWLVLGVNDHSGLALDMPFLATRSNVHVMPKP